jgi:hypothetical protein
MSAFTKSGRSSWLKSADFEGNFRPQAAIQTLDTAPVIEASTLQRKMSSHIRRNSPAAN